MLTGSGATRSGASRSDRFYKNPVLRDLEWYRATQPPGWLMILALAITGAAFFMGVYAGEPHSTAGWTVGILTILGYVGLGWLRRRRAPQRLRSIHGQRTAGLPR